MDTSVIHDVLGRVSGGENLEMGEMSRVIDAIMRGEWNEQQIMLLLNALRVKEETIDELAGAAAAMRQHMTPIRTRRTGVMDTCGTGGVASQLFNVSTAAAIVTAAAGVPVAKHGNRSITSQSGSADVLRELGVNVDAPVATVERCLDELGICFCFALHLHPAMKNVAAARKKLGVRTLFNLLGPLCNPASASYQLLGVGAGELRPKIAGALAKLGTRRAVVVTGDDGMGEVTLGAATQVTVVEGDQTRHTTWRPADFGLTEESNETMRIEGPADSALRIRDIFAGSAGAPRNIVIANAAAALWTAGVSDALTECARRAAQAIDSGKARELLRRLGEVSRA